MTVRVQDGPWTLRPLGEVCEILDRMRRPINAAERAERLGPYPYYGANGQVGTIDEYIFDEELVLVAEDGGFFFDPLRPIAYRVSGKCWVNNHAHVLRARDGLDPEWLCYAIAFQDVSSLVKGATRPKLNQKELREIPVPIPTPEEQHRIVARVRACMDRVEEVRGLRVATVEDAKRLEAAMFHDFILEGAAEKAWPSVQLGEITESSRYGTSAKATPESAGTPVLRMGNIVDGVLDYSKLKYMNLPRRDLEKYLLVPGDILINRTNSLELVGKAATFDRSDGDWVYASYLVCIRIDKTRAIPEYVTAVINSDIGRNYVLRTARRAIGMVNINAKEIARFPIPLPPIEEQREVVDRLAEVRSAARQIRESISVPDADHLVGAVLRKALAGEL